MTINGMVQQRTYTVDNEKRMRPLAARNRASEPAAAPSATPSFAQALTSLSTSAPSTSPVSPSSLALSTSPVASSSLPASMTSSPEPSPTVVSSAAAPAAASPSLSVDREAVENDDGIENDDEDDDEMLLPMTDAEWECFATRPPSADHINDARDLVTRRRKKVAQLPRSGRTPQRRKRGTSIIRAFLLKPVQLKEGKQKLTYAQRALTFDEAAPWRSAHNRMCLNLDLRRFVADRVTQDAVMPEVLADTALAMLSDFLDALEHEDDDKLTRLHVQTQPAFRSWIMSRIYQL